ncbi:MAG: hypothetical protein ACLPKI_14830 [Streptosporangiaceae bacterium]
MLRGSIGRPVLVVKMSLVSSQAWPSSARSAVWMARRVSRASAARSSRGQVAAASGGLDRADAQLAVDALDVLADAQLAVFLVHVAPVQAEDFTAAQPIEQQEHEGRVQRVILGGLQERAGLARGPRSDRFAFPGGQLGQPGDVAHDQLLAHHPGQRRRQHGLHDLDFPDRMAFGELAGQEGLHPGRRQAAQRVAAERWLGVQPDGRLIQGVRGGPAVRGDHVL